MSLSLLLTGDSILQRRLNSRDDAELKPLFDKVRAADVAFTNLEGLANDYRGVPALESELIVPTLGYEGGPNGRMTLRSIELTPISLGWKDARHRRGRPRLAEVAEGSAILDRFAELSRPFGTELCDEARSVRLA
jgi:hypothetical protein